MKDIYDACRQERDAFLNGVRFFTRIPVPDRIPYSETLLNHAAQYFPAIGLCIGLFAAAVYALAQSIFPQSVSILLAMASTIYITGAFHEDGLSDMADGLGGGWNKDKILEIMKDSRVGNYGVVAIVSALAFKFVCLAEVDVYWVPLLLVAGHAFSRYCAVLIMSGMHYARQGAGSGSKVKPLATHMSRNGLLVASVFGLAPLVFLPYPAMLLGLLGGLSITIWLGRKLQKWLGGYTGDCLGAVQQLSEVAFYLGALAALR